MSYIKVLWTHNFQPFLKFSGTFVHEFAKNIRDFGIDVQLFYTGQLKNPSNFLRARDKIKIISKKFDIIHSQYGSLCSLVSAGARSKKIISLRGSDWHRYSGEDFRQNLHGWGATSVSRLAIPHYDSVITMSNRMSSEVKRDFPDSRIHILPSPIDLSMFRPIERDYARKKMFDTQNNEPWILFTAVSISNPIKRVWLAEESVRLASQIIGNLNLKIASGVPRHLMPYFVSSCNVALSTSVHEGWPNSIKEALACNIPFVSTNISDLAEIAAKEPSCRISEPDPKSIAMHLCHVLKLNEKKDLVRFVEKMDMEITCRKLLRIYHEVLMH